MLASASQPAKCPPRRLWRTAGAVRGGGRNAIANLLLLETRRKVVAMAAPERAFAVGEHFPGPLQAAAVVVLITRSTRTRYCESLLIGAIEKARNELSAGGSRTDVCKQSRLLRRTVTAFTGLIAVFGARNALAIAIH
jgi:hypothetical protein